MAYPRSLWMVLPLCLAIGTVCAQDQNLPRYSLRQDQADTGTNIKRDVVSGSAIPIDKRYSEFTSEEQAHVKSWYERMGPNDEPPFPLDGLRPLYSAVAAAQQKLLVTGSLSVAVAVNTQGEATSVDVFRSPDSQMTRVVASILMLQKYKPAFCSGVACAMQFPFRIEFTTRRP